MAYRQTDRERREGRRTFLDDMYVIEISIKAGEKGELYETSKHEVSEIHMPHYITLYMYFILHKYCSS